MIEAFETKSVRMERMLLMVLQAPAGDVDRIMDAVGAVTPLQMGKYDRNAFQSGGGVERYRPLAGAAAPRETTWRPVIGSSDGATGRCTTSAIGVSRVT